MYFAGEYVCIIGTFRCLRSQMTINYTLRVTTRYLSSSYFYSYVHSHVHCHHIICTSYTKSKLSPRQIVDSLTFYEFRSSDESSLTLVQSRTGAAIHWQFRIADSLAEYMIRNLKLCFLFYSLQLVLFIRMFFFSCKQVELEKFQARFSLLFWFKIFFFFGSLFSFSSYFTFSH